MSDDLPSDGSVPLTRLKIPMPTGATEPNSTIVIPKKTNLEICEALGLDPYKIRRVTITLDYNGGTVIVEHLPVSTKQGTTIAHILRSMQQ